MRNREDVALRVGTALRLRLLYELQTGGGVALPTPRGAPAAEIEDRLAAIRSGVEELRSHFPGAPARLAAELGRPRMRVLDVGAGARPWSLAFAALSPAVRVTALDLPAEQAAVHVAVEEAGRGGQYELISANVFEDDLAALGTFDVVILANVCHLFDRARTRELLRRIAQCVSVGGVLAIVDQVLETSPDMARWCALYAVGVLHIGPGGHLHTVAHYEEWARQAGLGAIAARALCPLPPLSVVTAGKAA